MTPTLAAAVLIRTAAVARRQQPGRGGAAARSVRMTRSTRHHDGACCRDRTYLVNLAAGNGEREQNADDTDYLPGVVWAVQLAVSAESLLGVPGEKPDIRAGRHDRSRSD